MIIANWSHQDPSLELGIGGILCRPNGAVNGGRVGFQNVFGGCPKKAELIIDSKS